MKQNDQMGMTGHLEIWKIDGSGSEELVFDDHNVITSGMGAGLGLLYAGSGAGDITNFQIRHFQLGESGNTILDSYGPDQVALVAPLTLAVHYQTTTQSSIPVSTHEILDSDGTDFNSGTTYPFGIISDNAIKRVDLNSVTYILYIDQHSCNNKTLNEVGLFMKNPLGLTPDRSPLVAYRPFTNITKTNDFSLVFKWTLNF